MSTFYVYCNNLKISGRQFLPFCVPRVLNGSISDVLVNMTMLSAFNEICITFRKSS